MYICSIEWVSKNNLPMGNIALLCGGHHPQYQQYVAAATVAASTSTTSIVSPPFTALSTVAAANVIIGPSAPFFGDDCF
jgi:hypothetical protein